MKIKALLKCKGFSQLFVLVGMLLVVVAMPIAVKLVQQNQENRSNAASSISQTKKCKDVGGICQKKTSACGGTYVSNLCSKSNKGVSCCASVRDTDTCLDVGGRCVEKEATGSGTIKKDLCSKSNGSDIVCFVADGSKNPCTAMGGSCVTSTPKTSGGNCLIGQAAGFFDLKYTCKETGSTCCFPTDYDVNGECSPHTGEPLTAVPDDLCKSGIVVWDGGDNVGTDGTLNWKCRGFNDASTADCSAKFKIITDTSACLAVGGRCKDKNKEATGSGSYKPDLCSNKSNPSNVGCWVVTGSDSPCTAMTGKCIGNAGVTTSGGSCALTSQTTGIYNLSYTCKAKESACCLPATVSFGGQCKDYGKQVLSSVPTSLCISGTESWEDGDKIGSDGSLNWKCVGPNGGSSTSCSAKLKVDGKCNPDNSGDGKSVTAKLSLVQACTAGALSWLNDGKVKDNYYSWKCKGINGGKDVSCKARYNSCGAGGGTCVASKDACVNGKEGADKYKFCSSSTNKYCCILPGSTVIEVTSVTLTDSDSLSLKIGENKTLGFTVAPNDATNKNVVWSSDNTTVASVSDAGVVTALAAGTANIDIETVNGKTDKLVINVSSDTTSGQVTGVTLDRISLDLNINGRDSLIATVSPANADTSLTWTSDKPEVATVSQSGLVTGVAAGTANITVKTTNNKTATAVVTVSSNTANVPVTSVTLDPASLTLKVGLKQIFTANILPVDATDKTVTWSSSDTSILTVSSSGVAQGMAVGTADVIATTSNNKTGKVSVKVEAVTAGVTPADPVSTDAKISFKFAFKGIKSTVSSCFDQLGDLKLEVKNMSTNTFESGISTSFAAISGETTPAGDQIFEVANLGLNSDKFSGVNAFNYVKVKGPFHLQGRMCQNNQSGKLNDTSECNISLSGDKVYDFSNYPLLSGDINQDGMVNTIDYGKLKSYFNEEVDCGTNGDLNLDGVVNSVDAGLIKDSLSSRDDE